MKYAQLIENLPVWNRFLNVEVSAEYIKPIVDMHNALMSELNFIAQEKKSVLEKYNGRIDGGKVVIDNKDDVAKYNADIEYLMSGNVNVTPIVLRSSGIGSKMSPALVIALEGLVSIV